MTNIKKYENKNMTVTSNIIYYVDRITLKCNLIIIKIRKFIKL